MGKKTVLLLVGMLLVSTAALGGLYAQAGGTSISVGAIGVGADGGAVQTWSTEAPSWTPIAEAVGTINGGGLATLTVANTPASAYRVTVFLNNPHEMTAAYSYLNMCLKITKAVDDGAGPPAALHKSASGFTGADSLIDHDEDTSLESADCQILNAEKGFVSFIINSADGTRVDDVVGTLKLTAPVNTVDGENRAFNIGIQSGSFFTKTTAGTLNPSFTIEVRQS